MSDRFYPLIAQPVSNLNGRAIALILKVEFKDMRYSLIVLLTLLIAMCKQGFAASIKQTWHYLKYDGTTTSVVLNVERFSRSRVKYVVQVSDFSESIEVFPVAYGVLSRLKIFETPPVILKSDPETRLRGIILSGKSKDIEDAKETMQALYKSALTTLSADKLCPPVTDRVLFLSIKDAMALPYCLVKWP
jgi:hypothetical protein